MKNNILIVSLVLSVLIICAGVIPSGCAKSPFLDSVSPSREKPGEKVYLKGENFGKTKGKGAVIFDDDKTAFIVTWSDTTINCVIPDGLEKGQSNIIVKNSDGKDSNAIVMNIEETGPELNKENGLEQDGPEDGEHQESNNGDEQQTIPGNAFTNEQEEEAEKCKSAMIEYAEENSEEGIEFKVTQFWMNEECTEAEATLEGKWTTGPNAGQQVESPGITAQKDDGGWAVTDFGTGITLKHL